MNVIDPIHLSTARWSTLAASWLWPRWCWFMTYTVHLAPVWQRCLSSRSSNIEKNNARRKICPLGGRKIKTRSSTCRWPQYILLYRNARPVHQLLSRTCKMRMDTLSNWVNLSVRWYTRQTWLEARWKFG